MAEFLGAAFSPRAGRTQTSFPAQAARTMPRFGNTPRGRSGVTIAPPGSSAPGLSTGLPGGGTGVNLGRSIGGGGMMRMI